MDLVYHITAKFERDLKKLGSDDQRRVAVALDEAGPFFLQGQMPPSSQVKKLRQPRLQAGLDSSLYVMRVSTHLRVFLTLDPDPLFGEMAVTLLRVARRDKMEKVYDGLIESLYQDLLHR